MGLQGSRARRRRVVAPERPDELLHRQPSSGGDHQRAEQPALRFEDLLATALELRGPPARCGQLCREALALWRGEPFGDLVDDEPFRLESMRLDELRDTAMELALACELALGHDELVVAELESAVEEHPFREQLWYLMIEALRCDGRRVEALAACRRLRATLTDAGLAAGAELEQLEERIVDDDGSATLLEAPPHGHSQEVPLRHPADVPAALAHRLPAQRREDDCGLPGAHAR